MGGGRPHRLSLPASALMLGSHLSPSWPRGSSRWLSFALGLASSSFLCVTVPFRLSVGVSACLSVPSLYTCTFQATQLPSEQQLSGHDG